MLGACGDSSLEGDPHRPASDLSDSGEVACLADPQPCGGALEGTWEQGADCQGSMAGTLDGCPSFQERFTSLPTSTYTFHGSTYTNVSVGDLVLETTMDRSCVGLDCAAISYPEAGLICIGTNKCTCQATFPSTGTYEGTLAIDGNTVTLTDSDGMTTTYGYCVQGNRLYLLGEGGSQTAYRRKS